MPPSLSRRSRTIPTAIALLLALAVLVAACGGDPGRDDADPHTGAHGAFPVSVRSGPTTGGAEITVDSRPTSIVSLSPTATEMLWAIGAGDQVAAVDDQSDYPKGVPTTELSGYEPNVEAILGHEPDLVVAAGDSGDLVSGLKAVGVPVLLLPSAADLDESYSQIERLGAATGHVAEAAGVVAHMRTGIKAAVAKAPHAAGLTYFHELSPDLYTATSDTFIGEIYGMFGLHSIADAAGKGDDYPQLSSESVVSQDPDLVFLADGSCCGVTPDDVGARPGWQQMSAVRGDRIHEVDADITSRWGPRVVEFAEQVGRLLAEHAQRAQSTG